MRWYLFILVVLAAAVLEAGSLLNLIAFDQGQIRPSVLIPLLVFTALHAEPDEAILGSFLIGFAADMAGSVMGPFTVCCGLAGSLLGQTQGLLTLKRPVYQIIAVFLSTLLITLFAHWLAMLKTAEAGILPFTVLLGRALYTGAAAPVLWPLFNLLWKYLGKPLSGRTSRNRIGHV